MSLYLGIDTSCYTTSMAVMDSGGNLIIDSRKLLPVPLGSAGLQQSKGVWQHLQQLPEVMAQYNNQLGKLKAIAVSSKPRPQDDSYMPVFQPGVVVAQSLAQVLGIPLIRTTHQEGHIMAGIWSVNRPIGKNFLSIHLSGGTTEVLLVNVTKEEPVELTIEILGETLDLHAGQLVDRVGVALGLPFPAGKHIEALAQGGTGSLKIASSVNGMNLNLSGAEAAAFRAIEIGTPYEEVALAVLQVVANSVEKVLRTAIVTTGINNVLLVGGVTANKYIRSRLIKRLEHRAVGAKLFFPQPQYSTDNAVGVSAIAKGWNFANEE